MVTYLLRGRIGTATKVAVSSVAPVTEVLLKVELAATRLEGHHCGNLKPSDILFTGPNGEYDGSDKLHILLERHIQTCKMEKNQDKTKQYSGNCIDITGQHQIKASKALAKRNGNFYWISGSSHSAGVYTAPDRAWPYPYNPHCHIHQNGCRPQEVLDKKLFDRPAVGHSAPQGLAFKSDDELWLTATAGKEIVLCTLSTKTCTPYWTQDKNNAAEYNQADCLLSAGDGTLFFGGYWNQVSKCSAANTCPIILGGPDRKSHSDEKGFKRVMRLKFAAR